MTNSLCLRESERVYYYCVLDGYIAQTLLCPKPLLFASERLKSANNNFTELLTQSEIEIRVQCSIVPSLLVCEVGHIYLQSLSQCRSVYCLWSRWIVFAMKWETNVMKTVVYISGQEIVVYIYISTVEVMWKMPREMCWSSGSNSVQASSDEKWYLLSVNGPLFCWVWFRNSKRNWVILGAGTSSRRK